MGGMGGGMITAYCPCKQYTSYDNVKVRGEINSYIREIFAFDPFSFASFDPIVSGGILNLANFLFNVF